MVWGKVRFFQGERTGAFWEAWVPIAGFAADRWQTLGLREGHVARWSKTQGARSTELPWLSLDFEARGGCLGPKESLSRGGGFQNGLAGESRRALVLNESLGEFQGCVASDFDTHLLGPIQRMVTHKKEQWSLISHAGSLNWPPRLNALSGRDVGMEKRHFTWYSGTVVSFRR